MTVSDLSSFHLLCRHLDMFCVPTQPFVRSIMCPRLDGLEKDLGDDFPQMVRVSKSWSEQTAPIYPHAGKSHPQAHRSYDVPNLSSWLVGSLQLPPTPNLTLYRIHLHFPRLHEWARRACSHQFPYSPSIQSLESATEDQKAGAGPPSLSFTSFTGVTAEMMTLAIPPHCPAVLRAFSECSEALLQSP
jgi:hypothetical protein